MYEYAEDVISTMKVSVNKNRDGNIQQEGEVIAGVENFTFKGFASSISASETVNDKDSPALHNGVSGLVWLFSGYDEGNFDENFTKISTEVMEDV